MLILGEKHTTGKVVGTHMKLSEIVEQTIVLARERRGESAGSESQDGIVFGRSAADEKLTAFLHNQPVAVIYSLVMIMYSGRGDFPISDFREQYQEMRDTFDRPDYAVNQMREKTPLSDYLEEGLRLLQENGIDVDTLLG